MIHLYVSEQPYNIGRAGKILLMSHLYKDVSQLKVKLKKFVTVIQSSVCRRVLGFNPSGWEQKHLGAAGFGGWLVNWLHLFSPLVCFPLKDVNCVSSKGQR